MFLIMIVILISIYHQENFILIEVCGACIHCWKKET
jgi:hypothetical protein